MYIAAISVIIAIGCGDNGVQDKSQRVGDFINMFVDVGTPPTDVQYTLTVNVFPPEGGTVLRNPDTDSYKAGTSVSLTAKSNNGYTFLGWSGAINSANPEITITMNGDKTLTANFNDGRPTYDVYFNSNDASGGAPLSVRTISGSAITLPDQGSMERPGYSFAGWTKDKSGTGTLYAPNSSYTVTEGVTLYAKWLPITVTKKYAVAVSSAGTGAAGGGEYVPKDTVTVTAGTPPSGQQFKVWASSVAGVTFAPSANNVTVTFIMPDAAVTVTAVFEPIPADAYAITFNPGNGATVSPASRATDTDGRLASLPTPTKTGYTFIGWFAADTASDTSGTRVIAGATGTVFKANTVIYARWTLTTYTITYALNDGTATANLTSYTIETATFKLNNPTRTGYAFAGWTEANDMTMIDTAVTVAKGSTGNKSYTANWLVVAYTITYNLDGGTVASANPANYTVETATFRLNNPTKTGYTFAGWTGSNGATPQTTVFVANGSAGAKSYTANWTTSVGGSYESVVIGGKTWMAKNLNVQTASGSWCYGNKPDSCAKYGMLYDWATANKVCPTGWHLPSRQEWVDLAKAAGGTGDYGTDGTAGKALKSTSGWYNNGNGTDSLGFSALPGGYRGSDGGFYYAGSSGNWWTATEGSSDNAYRWYMYYDNGIVREGNDNKICGFSVRCVHDR